MAKQEILKMTDEEVLKHYAANEIPAPDETEEAMNTEVKKIIEENLASKPDFVKAQLAVDHVMSKRKSGVIEIIPSKDEDEKDPHQ